MKIMESLSQRLDRMKKIWEKGNFNWYLFGLLCSNIPKSDPKGRNKSNRKSSNSSYEVFFDITWGFCESDWTASKLVNLFSKIPLYNMHCTNFPSFSWMLFSRVVREEWRLASNLELAKLFSSECLTRSLFFLNY